MIVIQGGLSDGKKGDDDLNSEFMEKFTKAVDQLVKKNCAFKAVFVPYGTFPRVDSGKLRVRDIEGFEWSSCEWPKIACPDGVCAEVCPLPSPTPKTNSNTNPNTNTNTNSRNRNN
jgi:hypothetical protein